MKLNQFKRGFVQVVTPVQFPVLFGDELGEPGHAVRAALDPVAKFSDMLFLYRLSDLERRQLKVEFNNPGVDAVVV